MGAHAVHPPVTPSSSAEVIELEKQFVLQNYSRYPLVVHRGKGPYVYDLEGKRYLDLITGIGVNALGHAHPRLVKVVREQVSHLIHCSNLYYHEYQGPLAQKLAAISGLERAFFCNSGAEAVEGAIKMIRSHGHKKSPARTGILAVENSFHGRTTGALSLTGQPKYRKDFEPLLEGVQFISPNDEDALERTFATKSVAGVMLECIQGEGGVYPLEESFVRKARALCDRHNALLAFDEIQCGLGRTGDYFAYQTYKPAVMPDIAVVAKPMAGGLPIGAILANEKAASAIAPGMHGSTFGGNALVCRAALEFLSLLDELLPEIKRMGGYFRMRLEELKLHYRYIKEVRVFGLMIGIELVIPGKQIVLDAMEEGLLINCTHEKVLRFLPPYILTEQDIDRAIAALNKTLRKGRRYFVESGLAKD
jgi:acetylornithine/N-succinyldiaminopimelate aminotransferase